MKTIEEAALWLQNRDHFLILTHRRPDGDTTGCAIALCQGLRSIGKDAWIWENPQFTARYLPRLAGLTTAEVHDNTTVVAVDLATENLLPMNGAQFAGTIELCIDHHPSNEGYAKETLLEAHSAACGEIIWELLEKLHADISPDMAEAIYLAISTDTGCFRFNNTTARTFRTAAMTVEHGAKIGPINRALFEIKSKGRLQLEAKIMEIIEFYAEGSVAICCLDQKLVEELGVTEDDLDSISGFPRTIEGVNVGVMIRNSEPGKAKMSVRTAPGFDASAYCQKIGGGGHVAAAGAAVPGTLEDGKRAILQVLKEEKVL